MIAPPRSRAQIGRQPPHRYPHEAQAGGGATHTVRAIADATLGKQAGQSATDAAVHLGLARTGIVVITISGLTRRRSVVPDALIQADLQGRQFPFRGLGTDTQSRAIIIEAEY
ncbi:hypothetical protein AO734_21250 [Aeromonas veronii]|uniref:hypothetical protein n=1 Tax=Aeromonas veronii TaxID=654 RepID=UPI000718A2D2|nr:hypothetical protein AO734_21250 [Aeromonas veronii]